MQEATAALFKQAIEQVKSPKEAHREHLARCALKRRKTIDGVAAVVDTEAKQEPPTSGGASGSSGRSEPAAADIRELVAKDLSSNQSPLPGQGGGA